MLMDNLEKICKVKAIFKAIKFILLFILLLLCYFIMFRYVTNCTFQKEITKKKNYCKNMNVLDRKL